METRNSWERSLQKQPQHRAEGWEERKSPLECSWSLLGTQHCILPRMKEPQQEFFPFQGFSWGCLSFGSTSEGSLLPEVMETTPQGCSTPAFPPGDPVGLWAPSAPAKSHPAGLGKLPEGPQLPPSPARMALDQSRWIFTPRN